MMPKERLRVGICTIDELIGDSQFQLVIDDPANLSPPDVKRLLLCSGKVYFTLAAAREKQGITDTALVRVEQPYPFPSREIGGIFNRYRSARQIFWVQEEPKNRGCWSFMEPRLRDLLPAGASLGYIGLPAAASPATGSAAEHKHETEEIIKQSLDLANRPAPAAPVPASSATPTTAATPAPVAK